MQKPLFAHQLTYPVQSCKAKEICKKESFGAKEVELNALLHIYTFYCVCDQCKSRSSSTNVPADLDLHCLCAP
jgi:hypothetical protein